MTLRHATGLALIFLLMGASAAAQEPTYRVVSDTTASADSLWQMDMAPVVVTATRAERAAGKVPVPVSVIGQEEIERRGASRLTDLLSEEPGLTVSSDHGSGLQIRGLGPEYTLILIDGEPVIGRTAGTLDLSAQMEGRRGPWQGSVSVDRYRTGGYDLAPQTMTPTRPGYVDYTARARGQYEAGPHTTLSVQGRLASQSQDYTVGVRPAGANSEVPYDQSASRLDWSVAPEIEQGLGGGWTLTGTLYGAGYHTDQMLRRAADGTVRSSSALDQHHGKAEAILRGALGNSHLLTVGGGAILETVDADRNSGTRRGGFGFVQDEWRPTDAVNVTGSVRLDANSDYASRLSPKLAVRYDVFDALSLQASVGSGYKAPAFRQLYLDFTNPTAGYTVLGATEVRAGLQRLREQGRIKELVRDPATLGDPLQPETSWAFNVGLTARTGSRVTARLNVYHNEISDLITTEAVATKPNGQQVFTYVNRNEVFTRGLEARITVRPLPDLSFRLGYDYLDARDRRVLEAIDEGSIYRREDGRAVRVDHSEYGGLPGRSTHSGTAQVRYTVPSLGLTASVRGVLRGRYGHVDRNGNNIIDVPREYVDRHTLWDITLSKTLFDDYTMRMGSENLLDYTNPSRIPSLPGRRWFAEVQARF